MTCLWSTLNRIFWLWCVIIVWATEFLSPGAPLPLSTNLPMPYQNPEFPSPYFVGGALSMAPGCAK